MRLALVVLLLGSLLGGCKRHAAENTTSAPFGVCLGPHGWRTAKIRVEPGDEVTVVVAPTGGNCISSSMRVEEAPRVRRTGPSSFAIQGQLLLAAPEQGGPALADCGGGIVELSLGPLPAGHYVVRTPSPLEFDVPMDREMTKPVCASPPPVRATPTASAP